jgi:hypothetical protein
MVSTTLVIAVIATAIISSVVSTIIVAAVVIAPVIVAATVIMPVIAAISVTTIVVTLPWRRAGLCVRRQTSQPHAGSNGRGKKAGCPTGFHQMCSFSILAGKSTCHEGDDHPISSDRHAGQFCFTPIFLALYKAEKSLQK